MAGRWARWADILLGPVVEAPAPPPYAAAHAAEFDGELPAALTASGRVVEIGQLTKRRKLPGEQEWQKEAWHHYNRSGELQYAAAWMANSLSRVRLYASEVGEDGRPGKPTDNAKAKKIAAELFGGPAGATQ